MAAGTQGPRTDDLYVGQIFISRHLDINSQGNLGRATTGVLRGETTKMKPLCLPDFPSDYSWKIIRTFNQSPRSPQTDRFIKDLLESILNLEMFDSVVIVDTISDLLTLVKDHFHLEMKRCSILSLLLSDHRLHEFCLPSALIAACVNIYTMRILNWQNSLREDKDGEW